MTTYKEGQKAYYTDKHNRNLPTFKSMVKKLLAGWWKIISIRIDEPEFGHRRVVIFFHDEEKK